MDKQLFLQKVLLIVMLYFEGLRESNKCNAGKVHYISTEHPKITYFNPKYFGGLNMTTQRFGRRNPMYYVNLHTTTLVQFNYNVTVDIYFFELLTNVYKRSFVEMHFEFCHMVDHDPFFGAAMKQGKLVKPCPHPPGYYVFHNMSIDIRVVPQNFPFQKGRIYCNFSSMDTKEYMAGGYIDMEVKGLSKRVKEPKTAT